MDETPTYIDSTSNRIVSRKGATSVEVLHTGNDKSRFTSVLSIAADGTRLPTYIILKKLLKIPNVKMSSNIVLNRSDTAFMDNHLMKDYIDRVILPYTKGKKTFLVLYDFSAHKSQSTIDYLASNNIK